MQISLKKSQSGKWVYRFEPNRVAIHGNRVVTLTANSREIGFSNYATFLAIQVFNLR